MSVSRLPVEFEKQMMSQLGEEEFALFEKSLAEEPLTSIRVNPFKPALLDFPIHGQVPWSSEGFFLRERPVFTLDPLFHAGAYYVQESSSMFLSHILSCIEAPRDGVFLDLSAAPGGKSTLLGSYLAESGFLVANEVIKSRANILKENTIKWGLGNIMVTQNDPGHFSYLEGFFDLVLVDAPCSGEGMFRKDPEAIQEWSPDHVQLCAMRQQRIIEEAAALVKAGGYLVYSTCTFNQRENEEIVRFVVSEYAYQPVRIDLEKDWKIVESTIQTEEGVFFGYRFFPHLVPGEGFFVTVFKRPDDAASQEPRKAKDFKHPFLNSIGRGDSRQLIEKFGLPDNSAFYKLQDSVFWINADFQVTFEYLSRFLNIRYFGVELGQFSKNQILPSHEWATSILPKAGFATLEMDMQQAVSFLRKEEFTLPENLVEGWHLVSYQKMPLGWIKNLGNRFNNYYPKEWRIRMQAGEDAT